MTDEVQTTDTQLALSEVAREVHGSDFHGITHSENVEDEQFSARMRGYQVMAQEKAKGLDAGVNRKESTDAPGTAPQWTNDDLRVLTAFQGEAQRFKADYEQAVQKFAGININELERTDRARAVAVRVDARECAQQIQQRHAQLQQVAQQIDQAVTFRQLLAVRETEMQKMTTAEPRLADPAVREQVNEYLLSEGFTRDEIGSIFDHRAVIQAYRAMQAGKSPQPRKVPVFKRRPQSQTDEVGRARTKLQRTGHIEDAVALLTACRGAAQ